MRREALLECVRAAPLSRPPLLQGDEPAKAALLAALQSAARREFATLVFADNDVVQYQEVKSAIRERVQRVLRCRDDRLAAQVE